MKKIVVYILLIISLSSCEKEFYDLSDIQQEILFKVEIANSAWSPTHTGILINKYGDIYGFNLPESWNYPDENGIITSTKIIENFEQANELLGTIEPSDLIKYLNKLYKVDPDNLTDPESQWRDLGTNTSSGYFYNEENDAYEEVLLRQTGNVFIENKSREANQIYNWLMTLL